MPSRGPPDDMAKPLLNNSGGQSGGGGAATASSPQVAHPVVRQPYVPPEPPIDPGNFVGAGYIRTFQGIRSPKISASSLLCGTFWVMQGGSENDFWGYNASFWLLTLSSAVFLGLIGPYFFVGKYADAETRVVVGCWVYGVLVWSLAINFGALLRTHYSDPGVMPRRPRSKDDDPAPTDEPTAGSGRMLLSPKRKRVAIGREGSLVALKYCPTCHFWRPPRASHCSDCDHCVERFDHHCPWVGNCIGKRNYFSFVIFVTMTTVNSILSCCLAIAQAVLVYYNEGSGGPLDGFIQPPPANTIISIGFAIAMALAWCTMIGMCGYTWAMIFGGRTTHEALGGSSRVLYERGSIWRNVAQQLLPAYYPRYIRHELAQLPQDFGDTYIPGYFD